MSRPIACRSGARVVVVVVLVLISQLAATSLRADQTTAAETSFAAFEAAVQQQSESLPTPAGLPDSPAPTGDAPSLILADVIASLYRSYPKIIEARAQAGVAGGQAMQAAGAYDTKLDVFTLSEPTGFYENYRHGLSVARQTWWGGYVSAGYRIGRGSFQPWYKERQTDEAGEVKLAVVQPLLQGRAIDPQRVAVFQADLAQQAAEPLVQQTLLEASRDATLLYWQWVAAGAVQQAQAELLSLAQQRNEQFQVGVEAGKFAEIDLVLNRQLVAERQISLLQSEQKFHAAGFKLGLYLRDEAGQPLMPQTTWLPARFPAVEPPTLDSLENNLAAALTRRPELQLLQIEIQQLQWDRTLASNQTLARLDLIAEASQDMGAAATKSDDKGEFELLIGVEGEVPIQRRKARGKLLSTEAKLSQLHQKRRLATDQIAIELRTAANNLEIAAQVVQQTETALDAAVDTLDRFRFAFTQGKIDLISLNLLEVKTTEAAIKLIAAQTDWFTALSQLQVALGLDPLDQALLISQLPPSELPGPTTLPTTGSTTP